MFIRAFLKALVLAAVLALGFAAAATDCSPALSGTGAHLAHLRILERIAQSQRHGGFRVSSGEVETFWRSGWPLLREMAEINGTTVTAMMGDYFALMELMLGHDELFRKWLPLLRERFKGLQESAAQLESLAAETKMKARQWHWVRETLAGFRGFSLFVAMMEIQSNKTPGMDPLGHFDALAVESFLEIVEDLSLQMATPDTQAATPLLAPEPRVSAPAPAPAQMPGLVAAATLIDLIRLQLTPEPGALYPVTTVWGRSLQVRFAPELAASLAGSEGGKIRRLLRKIYTGKGDQSGIKMLPSLGPDIIEVKALMRGAHVRLFGCLKGDRLELRRFMEIKASIASYARRIPSDFCADVSH